MVVYTVGTFDLLHVGHLALLNKCKTFGDTVIVGVASDSVVASYKPNVPVIPLVQRQEMLEALSCVDSVRPYYDLEYVSACQDLNVDVFVVGEDWGKNPHNLAVESYLEKNNRQVIQVTYNPRTSSTEIKNNVMAQHSLAYSSKKLLPTQLEESHRLQSRATIQISVDSPTKSRH